MSGYCPGDKQWRWAWKSPETFSDAYPVSPPLPPYLSHRALDYYVAEFTRTDIQPANNSYIAIDKGWENTSFLDGAIVQQPALYVGGDRDPSTKPLFGIDRQAAAFKSLKQTSGTCVTSSSCRALVINRPKKSLKKLTLLFLSSSRISATSCRSACHLQWSETPIPQTPSAFHPHGQRNAFRRRDARRQCARSL